MEKGDKIALTVIGVLFAGLCIGILFFVRFVGGELLGLVDLGAGGVGWRDAFIASVVLSLGIIVLFAIVSGGGELVGELPFVLVGFFALIAFFTVSIALIL